MTDLSDRLAALTPAQRALLDLRSRKRNLDLSRASEAAADPTAPIPPRPPAPSHPLSIDQERIFFIHCLNPESPFYNIYTAVRWRGSIDPDLLRRALGEIARRHEIFRTRFVLVDGRPAQIVEAPFDMELPVIDLRALPAGAAWAEADREVTGLLKTPFALDRLPLVRFHLFRVREDELLWTLAFHHLVIDWVSFHAFQREVVLLYRAFSQGLPSPLPELPVQYADYAVWQRRQLTNEALAEQLAWWREQLREAPHVTELPLDRPRPAIQRGDGLRSPLVLSRTASDAIRGLARREGVTLFIAFLTLFKALIVRLAGQPRVVVGSPMVVREHPDLEQLLGFFLTQLVLYTDLSGDPGFLTALRRVRTTALGAFSHKETPFGQVVELVQPARDLSRMPLTQLTFLFLNPQHFGVPQMPGVEMLPYRFDGESSKFDVTLALWDRPERFDGLLEYNSELFERTTIERFGGYFQNLAEGALEDPWRPLSQLPLAAPAERHQMLVEWNDTLPTADAARGACVHELFERQARRSPEAPAVSGGDLTLTYRELDGAARELAAALRASGVRLEEAVGVMVRRSPDMVIALLGILYAGGAYLPLDPAYPAERLRYLLADSGARRLVTERSVAAERGEVLEGLPVQPVFLGELGGRTAATPAGGGALPGNLAYVLYTSGSTGKPKGVMISHRALVNFLLSMASRPGLAAGDRVLAVTTLSFDISGLEIYLPLLVGAHLVIADEETVRDGAALARRMAASRITFMQATPATWRLLLESGFTGGPGLRLLSGGEALPRDLAERLLGSCGELWNLYGPTETTIWSTAGRVASGNGPVALGRPIAATCAHVLDGELRPVPRGAAGEVFLGGEGLARGYLHQPALTAERFVPDPFAAAIGAPGGRLYRVGDLGRQRATGELEFLGRVDHQVKLRGFRIELGEIEAALAECPGVGEAVVVLLAAAGPGRGAGLVAFLVPAPGPGRDGSSAGAAGAWGQELRAELRRRLPEHMVPARFTVLERMPRTPNGKVDRAAFQRLEPPAVERPAAEDSSRHTPTEEILAAIWCAVLGRERIGVHEDFFAAGGHSLLAMQVLARIRDFFRIELPVRALFDAPTLAELAQRVWAAVRAGDATTVPPVVPRDRNTGPLPLSFAQQRLWFLDRLVPGSTFYSMPYGLRMAGRLEVAALAAALSEIAGRHEVLRTTFVELHGEAAQVVHPAAPRPLPLIDLQGLGETLRQGEALWLAQAEATRPFDLTAGPLWRTSLVRLAPGEHLLLLNQHHAVFDGWSIGILHRELEAVYGASIEGRPSPLPELPLQYADFAQWQRQWLQGEVLAAQLAHWRRQLGDAPPVLDLPSDRPRAPVQTFRGALCSFLLPVEAALALRHLGREHGTTLAMTLLAGLDTLLFRITGQDRILVGSPVAGRPATDLEGLIGFFVNTLVMAADLAGEPSFLELLGRVREVALDAYAHQDLPFEKLVEELELERDLSRNPLFQVAFALQNAPMAAPELPGLRLEPLGLEMHTTRFDLELQLWETPQGIAGFLSYDSDLFDATTIRRHLDHFQRLLEGAAALPGTPLAELPWLAPAERHQVLAEWGVGGFRAAAPPVHDRVAEQAAARPDAIAVSAGSACLTYGELQRRAALLAHRLHGLGVGPETVVGVLTGRSLEYPLACLGILAAGGAYLPLELSSPSLRLAAMLEDAGVEVVVVGQGRREVAEELAGGHRRLVPLASDEKRDEKRGENRGVRPRLEPGHPAYVIYTSGSTGQPKGVVVPHGALANLAAWHLETHGLTPADRATLVAAVGFDASVWELWPALAAGASLHIPGDDLYGSASGLLSWMAAENITLGFLPTPLAQSALREELPAGLRPRALFTGGDTLRPLGRVLPFPLIDLYGPTEGTVVTTSAALLPGDLRSGIGRPVSNVHVHVVDDAFGPSPIGVPGELVLGGGGLARGYLCQPALTAERFVPDPWGESPGGRLYRSGDAARFLSDGRLEFLGRLDHQVKLRGFRIETGEIEAALRQHPAVSQAVVVACGDLPGEGRESRRGERRLVAYVVPETTAATAPVSLPASEAAGLADESLAADQVAQWQAVFNDYVYDGLATEAGDAGLNIAGWRSSYTGASLGAAAMREWLEDRVERILCRGPRRVLEVGCGTGMLLFAIAPRCEAYWGTDFSRASLEYVRQQLAVPERPLPGVRLLERSADDWSGIEPRSFDAVVLNSVVQYFPSPEYLRQVLEQAVEAVAPGGFVFVGDVRSLPLLEAFHASLELSRAEPSTSRRELVRRVRRALVREKELALDPALFPALRERWPRLAAVELQLPSGRHANELSRFRYDVVLHVGDGLARPVAPAPDLRWLAWRREGLGVQELRRLLAEQAPPALGLLGVPNARVRDEARLLAWLAEQDRPETVGDFLRRKDEEAGAVDPDALRALGRELGYEVGLAWSPAAAGAGSSGLGSYDVLMARPNGDGAAGPAGGIPPATLLPLATGAPPLRAGLPSSPYANHPLWGRFAEGLVPVLRSFLRERLPDFMVPAAFMVLEEMPLTPHGKIDRRALPAPEETRPAVRTAARTPVEERLAAIWGEVLDLPFVGVQDDFFALGGHSLLAMRALSRVRDSFGVDLPVRALFEAPVLADLALRLEALRAAGGGAALAPPLVALPRSTGSACFPVSFAQQRLWFLDRLAPGSSYNMPAALRLSGPLHPASLAAALQEIARRHEMLRTTFGQVDGEPVQVVHPAPRSGLLQVDLESLGPAAEGAARRLAAREAAEPFDLAAGPLWRAVLLRLGPEDHVFLFDQHHIVSDGWSIGVFLRELEALYQAARQGRRSPLPELPVQYADFAVWQRQWLQGEVLAAQLGWWRERLGEAPPELSLPTDRPRSALQTSRGALQRLELPADLLAPLYALGRRREATPAMTLLAAFHALLFRLTGQETLLVGSPVAGRPQKQLEALIGFFVNSLVMVGDASGDPPFDELLGRVRRTALEAYSHQDVPFERLVEELTPERDASRNPLFQVIFALQNTPGLRLEIPGLTPTPFEFESRSTRLDLEIHLWDAAAGLHGFCSYRTDLFDPTTIARLLGQLRTLLRSAGESPGTRLSELDWLGEAQRHQVLFELGGRAGARVLDAFGQPLPFGVWGEVWSLDGDPPERTGERGRWLRDGALQLDAAALRRLELPGGPVVELWRIEEALLAAPEVEDCAVLVRQAGSGERLLVAYVVAAMPTTFERLARDLAAHCATRLAPEMRPAAWVPVAALPLTREGGLDREALLALEVLDGALVEHWEAALARLPDVGHAAVVVRDHAPRPARLHLLDLLPEHGTVGGMGMVADGGDGTAGVPRERRTPTADEVASRPPALARGGALEIPEDAPLTLTEALLRTAREHPDRGIVHVRPDGSELFQSYPALLASARSVLTGLRRAGLRPGDRLILQVPRPEDHFTGFWAAVLGGITPVTVAVPPSYEERTAVVNKLYNTWKLLGRPAVLTSEDLREPLGGLARRLGEEAMEVLSVDELATQPPADDVHPAAADDLVFLQLTSGSTGIPKCIQERHRGVVAHIHGSRQFNRFRPDDVILNWLPMDHVVPTLTYHLKDVYLGCQEIQIPPALVLAAPLLWLDRIEAHRVTHTWAPNFGFKLVSEQLAQNPGRRWDLSSLRYAMNAGEQVTMPVVREFLERVAPFGVSERVMQPAYGMAEVCTAMTYGSDFSVANGSRRFRKSTLNGLLEPAAPEDTEPAVDFIDVGPPIPGVDVRIVDRQSRLLPEGVIGRLQIQGEVVTPGYLENAEANREAFAGDNWFNTGDLGFLLDGRLSITGREKEIIIVRGANFYCYEIEDVVNGVEGVEPTWSGACGLADSRSGTEELAVFFVPAGAQEELRIDRRTVEVVERVRAAVTSSLGISPRRVVPMTAAEFPKTTSGKIQRTQLKSWLEEGRFTESLKRLDLLEENANTLPDWFHRKVWRRREGTPERRQSKGGALVFADAAGLGDFVAAGLERAGQPAVLVEPGGAWERPGPGRFRIDPADPEHYRRLLTETGQTLGEIGRVVHLWTWGDSTRGAAGTGGLEELRRAQREGAVSLLLLIQALERHRAISGRAGAEDRVQLLAVSSHSQPVLPDDRLACGRGTLPPLVKTAPQELPWLDARHLDLPAEDVEAAGAPVLHELAIVSGEREVALRQGRRLVARLARIEPRAAARTRQVPFRRGGRYLITGGAGGLGAEVARFLLETYGARLLLAGRSPLSGAPEAGLVLGRLQTLGDCVYEPADVCDELALEGAVRRAEERWGGPLDGALHLAGAYHERLLSEETAESFGEILRPKVEGAWVLRELLRRRPGALFVTFSSVNSFFGGFRVGAYAAANGFLECLAHVPAGEDGPRSRCLAWSLWDERGISRGRAMQQPAAARGFRAVPLGQGLASLDIALGLDHPAVLIGLASERANVRRLLDAADCRAQQAEVFLTLRSAAAPAVRMEMVDRFGTPARGELRILAEMPLAHGRPDRQQLLLLDRSLGPEPVAPRNEMERRLLVLWQEVLEAPRLGVEDNFFRFGGHSLLALRLLARIQQELGVEAPLATLFTAPTVARMAQLFAGGAEVSPAWSAVVPIQPAGDRPPFFCVAPVLGTVFPYFELARHLGTDQPFYGLQPPALTPDGPPLARIEDLAAFFVDALRSVQPAGPWYLGGWSFGTLVAHEMARQLQERGEEVRLVAHLDAPAPVRSQRLSPVRALRSFYEVVLRHFWPYVRDYFYLKTLTETEEEKGNGHRSPGLARVLHRVRSLGSLRSLVEGAAIASVVPRESRLVMFHPPEIRAMLRALRQNGRAMSHYTAAPYAGRATLFRTRGEWNGGKDPTLGWGEITQGVEVRWIPGNHMTLLRSPHVEVLAKLLRESLETSQRRSV